MINRYLKLQFVSALLFLLIFTSCNRNNDIDNFSETPAERLSKTNAELKDALTSSKDGWKIMYFTDNREFGGFTYLMSFTPDGKVKMVSDFDKASLVPETSDYEIQSSYAPALVFTTRNKIHQLSNADNSPGRQEGAGYRGDFEFVFDKIDEKGDIYFRTARSNVGIVFTKAKAEDWNNLNKNFTTKENALIGSSEQPFFSVLEIKEGGNIQSYSFSYDDITRFITLTSEDPSNSFNMKYGVGFKENSIILSPAVKVGNEELSELIYDSANKAYIAKGKQGEVVMKFVDKPVDPAQFGLGKEILEGKRLDIGHVKPFIDMDINGGNTTTALNVVKNILNAKKNPVTRINIRFNYPESGQVVNKIEYIFADQIILHYVDIAKGENNAIILKDNRWSSTPVPESLKALDDYLLDPKGLLLKTENYTVFYTNTIVTLKAVSSLSIRKTAFGLSYYKL
ncbi:TPA: DUF4302 domain-containing protein [Elizabethkingia anophelis]